MTTHNFPAALILLAAASLPASAQTTPAAPAQATAQVAAACAAPRTLNGLWQGNDGSTLALRQIGTQVWALGQSQNRGQAWTSVFRGVRVGDTVSGTWSDVAGARRSNGALTLRSGAGVNDLTALVRVSGTGAQGAAHWVFVCNDVPNAPQP